MLQVVCVSGGGIGIGGKARSSNDVMEIQREIDQEIATTREDTLAAPPNPIPPPPPIRSAIWSKARTTARRASEEQAARRAAAEVEVLNR